jgi:diguanylate cyclase (GGDEF)-like protein/PAS domain S-box-containing protein
LAISPQFALVPPSDPVSAPASDCVYSHDLEGNIVEINAAMARVTGYGREEARQMNLRELLEPESWLSSHEQTLAQLGGAGSQELEVTAIGKDGQRVRLRVARRLLFEQGRPVAIQDSGRPIQGIDAEQNPLSQDAFPEQIKQLHQLSTTTYATLEQALDDHLQTGCRLFDLPIGLVIQVEGSDGVVQASHGAEDLRAGTAIPLSVTQGWTVAARLRTITASQPAASRNHLRREFETYIGTPIWAGSELFGTLSFSAPFNGRSRTFSPAEAELIELMARGVGRAILEHRVHAERRGRERLEKSRNRVLEMVAENHSVEASMEQVAYLVEGQCPEALCSLLVLEDEMLAWATAPGFPSELVRLLKPIRVLRGAAGLPTAEVARAIVLWDDLPACPFWAERAHLAAQIGIQSCLSAPVLSSGGALLGIIALHYRVRQPRDAHDGEVLQIASRLAAMALERRTLTEELEFRARHDSLTGLPNRAYFFELLEAALREAGERSATLAVLFMDLDRFKQINDILGHALGDRLLKEVGGRLKRLLTEDDLAGRMGGDEFTIVLTRQPDQQAAIRASQEFLNSFRAPHQIEENELFVTASIGVAFYPQHGRDAAELLRNADLAMYHAKNSGKNDVEVFRAEDHAAGLERLRLENALRRALENNEFELLYQPLVGMNGKVEGLEALLTWRHPIYGTISPKQFIPIAEETGLIIDIGSWVIREACLVAAGWSRAGYRAARVSVNVSALQFERRDFLDTVATALSLSNLPPDRLELELTESYVMRDLPQSAARLTQLRHLGVSVAIDDFGTGYSSLSYLSKLPVDSLKIDQSFLRNLNEPEGSLPVLQSIVRLAHSMGLTVVAEGVETRVELDLVRALGCDRVQGHVYGPALRREEVEALFSSQDSLAPLET